MSNNGFGTPPGGGSGSGGFGAPPGGGGGFGAPPGGGGGFGAPPGGGGGFGAPPPGAPPPGGGFGGPPGGGAPPSGPYQPPPARPSADFSAAMDAAKQVGSNMISTGLLGGFVIMAIVSYVSLIPLIISQYLRVSAMQDFLEGDIAAMGTSNMTASGISCGGLVFVILVFAARLGLALPMRMIAIDGPQSVQGVGHTMRLAFSRFGPNLAVSLLYFVAIAVASLFCCFPGLIPMVMLTPATYLVANGRDLSDAFSTSIEWTKRHTGAIVGVWGVVIFVGILVSCCNFGPSSFMMTRFGAAGSAAWSAAAFLFGEVMSFGSLFLLGSACVAADKAESAGPAPGTPASPSSF